MLENKLGPSCKETANGTTIFTIYEYVGHSVFYLSLVFQISYFICPQVQKNSESVHLLMAIRCQVNVVSLKLTPKKRKKENLKNLRHK